jgi:hypothetical protein
MIKSEQYRIYQPNRDCLIFESYFTVHSPYNFKADATDFFNHDYFDNNDYCRGVYTDGYKDPAYDEETSKFLDKFGDYEVFGVECSSFRPLKMFKGEDGNLVFDYLTEPQLPDRDYISCFNIFITGYDKDHYYDCQMCYHSLLKNDPEDRNGCSRLPDEKDLECRSCWRYLENNRKGDRLK